ncbi:ATP-binding protein [Streptomyces chartreusis]|uniref:ATP-binding protein n=1 Tax=Streptomyces chartreusis TaxID=1969 RepID=UPI00365960B8
MLLELAGRHPLLRNSPTTRTACDRLVLDARRLLFASPLDLAAAAASAHLHADDGTPTALVLPRSPDVTSYLQRMDLITALPNGTHIEGDLPDETRKDQSLNLLEVTHLRPDTVGRISEQLGRLTLHHLGPRNGRRVCQGIGELIDNAIDHGASTCGAFIAAQAYSGKTTGYRRLEIAVCDTGVGVLDHLRRNPRHRLLSSSAAALERALQRGASGTEDKRGNGLPDLLTSSGATAATRLVLRSGDGLLRAGRHRGRGASVTHSFPTAMVIRGTWSWLRVSYRTKPTCASMN